MTCPECGGKVGTFDTRHNTEANEIYRKRVCKDCGNVFYTIEFEVEGNSDFFDLWRRYCRNR